MLQGVLASCLPIILWMMDQISENLGVELLCLGSLGGRANHFGELGGNDLLHLRQLV